MLNKSIHKHIELGSLFILLLIALILLPGTPISLADSSLTPPQPVLVLPTQSPLTVTHIIEAGDIPWDLAEIYDVSVEEILEANEIDDPSNLQIGQELIIPTDSDSSDSSEDITVDDETEVEDKLLSTENDTTISSTDPEAGTTETIIGQKSTASIAVATDETEVENKVSPKSNTTISTDTETETTETETTETVAQRKSVSPVAAETASYTIERGDTLLALAIDYDLDVETIIALNPDLDPTNLQIGQELLIPTSNNNNLAIENTPAIEKNKANVDKDNTKETTSYTIERGDTILALSIGYDLDIDEIMALNPGVNATNLQIGQVIELPGKLPARPPNPVATAPTTFSSSAATQPTTPQVVADQSTATGITKLEEEMIAAVNAERIAQGLPAYQLGPTLTIVARKHAADMVKRGYFAHVTPEGVTLRDRLAAQGLVVNWAGENIQKNTRSFDKTATHAFNWFMGSRPHRNNILHSRHTHIGVGVVEGPPGWYTFVLVFAKP